MITTRTKRALDIPLRKGLLLGILAITAFAAAAQGKVVDRVAVVVNSEIITQKEIDSQLAPIYEQYQALYYGDELVKKLDEARQHVLAKLIDDKLIISEAKRLNIEVDEKEVEAKISEARGRFASKEDLENALAGQGMSVKDLRVRFREQLMVRKLVDQTIGPKITITPIEVHDYYERYINEFVQPEVVTLRNILIKPKENVEVEKTLGLAKDILKRLRDGEDFAALAKEYSDGPNAQEGGLMIDVKKGDLLPEIEVIVFNLKKGEMSDIVQTSLGYHIFKVEERKERRTKELSEVKHEVEEAIFREKVNTKLRGWIDGLKENAYIEFK